MDTRGAAARRLDAIGLGQTLTFEQLHRAAEEYRGTTIHFQASTHLERGHVCGTWLGGGNIDIIQYPAGGSYAEIIATCCHEFGHMFDLAPTEFPAPDFSPEIAAALAAYIDVSRIVPYAARKSSVWDSEVEVSAERLGDECSVRLLRGRRLFRGAPTGFDRVFTSE